MGTAAPDTRRIRVAARVEELDFEHDLGAALALLSRHERPVLLDSAGGSPARWSVLGFDPVAPAPARPRSLLDLAALLERLEPADADPVPGPFAGGFLGALAYDLGVAGEELDLPAEPWGWPLACGGLYSDFLVRDESAGCTWLVLGDEPGDGRPPVSQRARDVRRALDRPPGAPAPARPLGALRRCTPPQEHRARVERCRDLIAAGEVYQANVAHRLLREVGGGPVDLYRRLRALNRAPYMGFVELPGHGALLSASPELLLEFEGGEARTRPIKGTAPRGATPEEDRANAAALLASEKDRAELGMIVDLERNDLGRVATPGGVRVDGLPTLESYASVHHLVSDVVATPRADASALDVLAALFPGGSVTGAPKLRAMEAIAELEGEGRGYFTGALGFLDVRGHAAFNVLIRTMLWRPLPGAGDAAEVSFRVGGGITWASDSAAEDAETLHKAASLAAALEA